MDNYTFQTILLSRNAHCASGFVAQEQTHQVANQPYTPLITRRMLGRLNLSLSNDEGSPYADRTKHKLPSIAA